MGSKGATKEEFDYSGIYYKMINPDGHNGLKYKLGLNVDPLPFDDDPEHTCVPGGIYFTNKYFLGIYYSYGTLVAEIRIPEDARVVRDPIGGIWRADRIEISRFIDRMEFFQGLPAQEGDLDLNDPSIEYLSGMEFPDVKKSIILNYVKRAENISFGRIGDSLKLDFADEIRDIKFNGDIGGALWLGKIREIRDIRLPNVGGAIFFDSLQEMEDVAFGSIGRLYLNSMKRLRGAVFPYIGKDFYAPSLEEVEDVSFGGIGGDFHAPNLRSIKNVVFGHIGKNFYAPNLRIFDGAAFGDIGGDLYAHVWPKGLDPRRVKGRIRISSERVSGAGWPRRMA